MIRTAAFPGLGMSEDIDNKSERITTEEMTEEILQELRREHKVYFLLSLCMKVGH
jgi:hypothetical protein